MKYNLTNDTSVIDPDIHNVLLSELERGRNGLEMIASENYASKAVMQVTGSILTNKYSEGYPGKRYYSCLLYTSPSPRDRQKSRMPSSA